MAEVAVRGLDCKLYRNTGTYVSPTWAEIEDVRDLSLVMKVDEADASSRRSKIKELIGALSEVSVEFDMVHRPADADWAALRAAFWNRITSSTTADRLIEVLCLDGDVLTTGSTGVRFTAEVFEFGEDQKLGEAVMNKVVLKPSAYAAQGPETYTV